MSNKTVHPARDSAIEAALALAAERGWAAVGMQDIATRSGQTMGELRELFADRYDILAAYGRRVDRRVLDAVGTADDGASPRDRLFDLLMERFDVLNEDRDGICAIIDALCPDPKQALLGLPHLCRSMGWMLEGAGLDIAGWRGMARVVGLTGVYVRTARVWRTDDSADMAKTMAALDKYLERAEIWGERLAR